MINLMSVSIAELNLIKTLAISRCNYERVNRDNIGTRLERMKWVNHHIMELEVLFTKHTQNIVADYGGYILLHKWQRAQLHGNQLTETYQPQTVGGFV